MNLPNKLTMLRIAMVFVFVPLLFVHGVWAKVGAFLVFLAASLTDLLDGYIAKKNGQVTDFGRLMDPIADKILILSAFLAFVEMGLVPAWMVLVIIFREVTVTGLRILAMSKGRIIPADAAGKHKTVSQVVVILLILICMIFRESGPPVSDFWTPGAEALYRDGVFFLMLITVVLTLISGVSYLVKNREVYSNAHAKKG
jgi:CDP-diacylglycerol--glycerol-3-phosphate 3-phosphatidyltransferase